MELQEEKLSGIVGSDVLFKTGVSVEEKTRENIKFMVLNIVTFLIIQLPALKNPYGEGVEFKFIYPAYIVSLLFCLTIFVYYIYVNYQKEVLGSDDDEERSPPQEGRRLSGSHSPGRKTSEDTKNTELVSVDKDSIKPEDTTIPEVKQPLITDKKVSDQDKDKMEIDEKINGFMDESINVFKKKMAESKDDDHVQLMDDLTQFSTDMNEFAEEIDQMNANLMGQ